MLIQAGEKAWDAGWSFYSHGACLTGLPTGWVWLDYPGSSAAVRYEIVNEDTGRVV